MTSYNSMFNESSIDGANLVNPDLSGVVTVGDYTLPTSGGADNKVLTGTSTTTSAWEYIPVPVISFVTASTAVVRKTLGDSNYLNLNTGIGTVSDMAYNGSNRWIAITTTNTFFSLNDGATWAACATNVPSAQRIDYDSSTGIWVITSYDATNKIWTSSDGNTFTGIITTNNFNGTATGVANDRAGNWVMVGGTSNKICYTSNPTNFEAYTGHGTTYLSGQGTACSYGNNIFLVGGVDSSNRIFYSTDKGVTFASQVGVHTTSTLSLAYSPELDIWVSAGYGGQVLGWNSNPQTTAWTGSGVLTTEQMNRVIWDTKRFIAVSSTGTIAYSYDGKTWTHQLYSASYLNLTPAASLISVTAKKYPKN